MKPVYDGQAKINIDEIGKKIDDRIAELTKYYEELSKRELVNAMQTDELLLKYNHSLTETYKHAIPCSYIVNAEEAKQIQLGETDETRMDLDRRR